MSRIENYRQVKQEAVEFEMKRRNARKNLDHALIASAEDSHVMQVEGERQNDRKDNREASAASRQKPLCIEPGSCRGLSLCIRCCIACTAWSHGASAFACDLICLSCHCLSAGLTGVAEKIRSKYGK